MWMVRGSGIGRALAPYQLPQNLPATGAARLGKRWSVRTDCRDPGRQGDRVLGTRSLTTRSIGLPTRPSPCGAVSRLGDRLLRMSNRGFLWDEVLHTKLQMSVEDLLKGFAVVAYFPEFEVAIPGGSQFQPNRLAVRRQYSGVRNSL